MLTSMNEFKFFKSFRVPVESKDDVRFMLERQDEYGKFKSVEDVKLADVSFSGLGFTSSVRISVGESVRVSILFKRLRLDMEGQVVRSIGAWPQSENMLYGVELDGEEHAHMKRFIEQYVASFSPERARDCITELALTERYQSAVEGFEVFSLMLSLFKDITSFGNKESFIESMLEEVVRILNAQRASIFLINPETNELEAIAALGIDKNLLKFDYRKGIAGSVFTTGIPLNIDTQTDEVRFSKEIDQKTGFVTRSILCAPISNREDKVIGVIEILNKRNEQRFTVDDEKTMKVLALIFSSVFHHYNPISERSLIRRFSTPYDREFAYIGRSSSTNDVRRSIVKLKDLDAPLLICGAFGVGKKLLGRIIHVEGKRGLKPFSIVSCKDSDSKLLEEKILGSVTKPSVLEECVGGTVVFDEISKMPMGLQAKLLEILEKKYIDGSSLTLDVRVIFTSTLAVDKLQSEGSQMNAALLRFANQSLLTIEPLKKRKPDIDDLLSYFLRKECRKQGLLLKEFSEECKTMLMEYEWPNNVDELQNVVSKAVLYNPKAHIITKLDEGSTPVMDPAHKALAALDDIPWAKDSTLPLKDRLNIIEREIILTEIKKFNGNKSQAAKAMGISREALRKKLIQSGVILGKLGTDNVDIDVDDESSEAA